LSQKFRNTDTSIALQYMIVRRQIYKKPTTFTPNMAGTYWGDIAACKAV